MALLTRLKDLLKGKSGAEEKINHLLAAFCDPDSVTDVTRLEEPRAACLARLRALAAADSSVQVWVDRISRAEAEGHPPWSDYSMLQIHQVAVGNAIIGLLGYYPGPSRDLDPDAAEAMRQSCEAQRSRIDLERVDRTRLREVLFTASEIKKLWEDRRWTMPQDRRYSVTVITPPEARARVETAQELQKR